MMRADRFHAIEPLRWEDDGISYIDQRCLPGELVRAQATDVANVIAAIETAAVSGARCIDMFAAFGAVLARATGSSTDELDDAIALLRAASERQYAAGVALERIASAPFGSELSEALASLAESTNVDRAIAENGAALLPSGGSILSLGSTGALSTGGEGTALAAIVAARRAGKHLHVYICETRPQQTGSRLSAFELSRANVPHTIVPDSAAAALIAGRTIGAVIVGATRLDTSGNVLGEIGTYGIAVVSAHHGVPFYAAVPRAAIHRSIGRGTDFDSFEASPPAYLFDITPAHLLTAIINEYGITRPPYFESLPILATRPRFDLVRNVPKQS